MPSNAQSVRRLPAANETVSRPTVRKSRPGENMWTWGLVGAILSGFFGGCALTGGYGSPPLGLCFVLLMAFGFSTSVCLCGAVVDRLDLIRCELQLQRKRRMK